MSNKLSLYKIFLISMEKVLGRAKHLENSLGDCSFPYEFLYEFTYFSLWVVAVFVMVTYTKLEGMDVMWRGWILSVFGKWGNSKRTKISIIRVTKGEVSGTSSISRNNGWKLLQFGKRPAVSPVYLNFSCFFYMSCNFLEKWIF